MAKRVEWHENGPDGDIFCSASVESAIEMAQQVAAYVGHKYKDDNEALQDFIAVHWAEVVDDIPSI